MSATFHKILVPVDRSELTQRVLDVAVTLAAGTGAQLVLLWVNADAATFESADATDIELNVIESDTAKLYTMLHDRPGAAALKPEQIEAEVRSGPVVEIICATVEDLLCDAIVMGTHGRHGLAEQLTGSTTEQVVAKTPASVFVVRPHGYPYLRD